MDFTGEIESASWIFNTIVARERIPVSEHLFAWRTTTTARLTDDAEAMGNDLDPVLCTVGPATAHRGSSGSGVLGVRPIWGVLGPGRPGWLPTQVPHRSGLAHHAHPV